MGEAAARLHGWCSTYDAILAELGLTRPVRRITGTITVTVNFDGTPNDAERAMSHDFVRDSLRLRNLEATDWFDSDWEDMDLTIDADQIVVSDLDMTDDRLTPRCVLSDPSRQSQGTGHPQGRPGEGRQVGPTQRCASIHD